MPTNELTELVAKCLKRVAREGLGAIDDVCREHPEDAEALRRRLSGLRDVGLFEHGRIGPYRLLRVLGRGGMGVVYMARDERLDRVVALKLLPSSLCTSQRARERFEREARAVAALNHDGIVPVHDVGEFDGAPYFTMEYVDGRPLNELIADGLSIKDACAITIDVADALQHAHERGVIHRDVKPSNVIVRDDGRAQLLDFGLARVESGETVTVTGDLAGTPSYLSPEQVAPRAAGVDTRTDVWSLGVTLYEMLAGRRPFADRTAQEVYRAILMREPVPLRRVNPGVSRDLQTITAKALEKLPAARYATAREMADDVRRVLAYEPIRARPAGVIARGARLVRRRPAAVAIAVLAAIMLVGSPWLLWHTHVSVSEERDRAQEMLRRKDAINKILLDMLRAPAPTRQGHDVTVLEMLDQAAATLQTEDVAVETDMRLTLGAMFNELGLYERAAEQLSAAEALGAQVNDDMQARALGNLGVARARTGALDEAVELFQRAVTIRRRVGPMDETAKAVSNLSSALAMRGDLDAAEALANEALDLRRRLGGDPRPLVESGINLALLASRRGDLGPAEACLRAALTDAEALAAPDDPLVVTALRNLASIVGRAGRWDEAIEFARRGLGLARSRFGDGHREVADLRVILGYCLVRAERAAEAKAELDLAIDAFALLSPNGEARYAAALMHRGAARADLEDCAGALADVERAIEMGDRFGRDGADARTLLGELRRRCEGA